MKLRTKLRALFLTVIGLSLATASLSLSSISRLSDALGASNANLATELAIRNLREKFSDPELDLELQRASRGEKEAEASVADRVRNWNAEIERISRELGDEREMEDFLQYLQDDSQKILDLNSRSREVIKHMGGDPTNLQLLDQMRRSTQSGIRAAIDDLIRRQHGRVEAATALATSREQQARTLIVITSVLLLAAAWLGQSLFRRWFLQPVEVLSEATHRIASGDYETKIPLAGENEFARLARDVETMSASIESFQGKLVEKERMAAVGEMTASVAHNVRNPLASIRALAQTCHREPELATPIRGALGTVIETVDRADRWLKDLLTALRPVKLTAVEQDLVEIVGEIVEASRTFAERKGIELRFEAEAGVPPLLLDRRRFEQALIVLISNSVEASPPESTIDILVSADPGPRQRIRVIVEDRGHGMNEETLGKLFTPYFTTKKSGVGLGLCLAQKIIFGHRGTIDVVSEVDRGCRMTIWLPIHDSTLSGAEPPRSDRSEATDGGP
ncbi:MAG: ATP-binding protein [Planctomycetota bacterium]